MSDELVVVDCDSVTLHEWRADADRASLGPQIGDRVRTDNTGSVAFRIEKNETAWVHAALWLGDTVVVWTEPRQVRRGNVYLVHLPVIGTFS